MNTKITVETAKNLGLNEEEFKNIKKILGRDPNFTELSIFSVMWSEHCSYKNSIYWLKTLPRESKRLLVEAGEENAGLVDIGDGLACAFKIESHNHPSAIEPYQGAATGVGGIHRDIFTMGARPIAALNSLRFGNIDLNRTKHLVRGVVSGIGDYGNCFGVPTIGGEVYFHDSYNENILVNAMSIGIVKSDETVSAIAEGAGNPVFIVGSATGKDGIHGATFASADLNDESAKDLPAVQVGDPFQEKLLLEATLDAVKTGAIVGMQDMGAAGITCSTSEMSAKGETGMSIDLDQVPTRQSGMEPFETLLSESQERMLVVCHKGMEEKLTAIYEKWDLQCQQIGQVTDTGQLEFYQGGEKVADVPAEALVLGGGAPVYKRSYKKPGYLKNLNKFQISKLDQPKDWVTTAKQILTSPNLVSKRWIFEQYDSTVRTNTVSSNLNTTAAIIRVKGTKKGIAATTDCNPFYVHADPYVGTMIAVCEAARNIVCSGGEPVAITNCLNFGNPYDPEVYWQFVQAIKGMTEACKKFDTPVTGGNVSFYNQTVKQNGQVLPIYPTPTIGMIGIINDLSSVLTLDFKADGHQIYMIGTPHNDMGSSEYLRQIHQIESSPVPKFDIDEEFHIQHNLKKLIQKNLIESAHDIAEGGLFTCLLECALANEMGFEIESDYNFRKDAYLFGESQSRIVVSTKHELEDELVNYLNSHNVPFTRLGEVGGRNIVVDEQDFGKVSDWKETYNTRLSSLLES